MAIVENECCYNMDEVMRYIGQLTIVETLTEKWAINSRYQEWTAKI